MNRTQTQEVGYYLQEGKANVHCSHTNLEKGESTHIKLAQNHTGDTTITMMGKDGLPSLGHLAQPTEH